MKIFLSKVGMVALFLAGSAAWMPARAASSNMDYTLTFTTRGTGGEYDPRHVLAVWVTDAKGHWIKTVRVDAHRERKELRTWRRESNGSVTDAVTGATLQRHGEVTATWNGTDSSGNAVPDGVYEFRAEYNSGGPSQVMPAGTAKFIKGAAPVKSTSAGTKDFSHITIGSEPSANPIRPTATTGAGVAGRGQSPSQRHPVPSAPARP